MVYNTLWWPFGSIYPETFRGMINFEQVVAIKWAVPKGCSYEDIYDHKNIFNIIDNDVHPVLNPRMGRRAHFQNEISVYPPRDLRIWELLEAQRYNAAQELFDSVVPNYMRLMKRFPHKVAGDAVEKLLWHKCADP